MDKKKILLDSIKKLTALDVSESEIKRHLREVGIESEDADKLIREAKGLPVATAVKEKIEKDSGGVMREVAETLELARNDKTNSDADKKREAETRAKSDKKSAKKIPPAHRKKPEEHVLWETPSFKKKFSASDEIPFEDKIFAPEKPPASRETSLNKLWEKGILITVNQRLNEIKKIQTDIEKTIESKVKQKTEKELNKQKVMFESERRLTIESAREKMDSKVKEITGLMDGKIAEMKELNKSIRENAEMLEKKKAEQSDSLAEFESKLGELQNTKKQLISEMNSELIKSKSSAQEFIDKSAEKIREIDERVSKTLELESKIAEGFIKDAKDRIDEIVLQKIEALKEEIEREISGLKEIREKVKPESINAQLDRLEKIEETLEEEQEQRLHALDDKIASRMRAFERMTATQYKELESKMKESYHKIIAEKMEEIDEVVSELTSDLNPEEFRSAMKELDTFKAQFVNVIEKNVAKFNTSIANLNQQSKQLEEQVNAKVKKIDSKIKELDEFEKNFAKEMGISLEKLTKKKGKK